MDQRRRIRRWADSFRVRSGEIWRGRSLPVSGGSAMKWNWPHWFHNWRHFYRDGLSGFAAFQYRQCKVCEKVQRRMKRRYNENKQQWRDI